MFKKSFKFSRRLAAFCAGTLELSYITFLAIFILYLYNGRGEHSRAC